MRSPLPDDPRLIVVRGAELPLSGQALLELMRAVLDRGAPFRFRARGWSMAPLIRDGDVITVSPLGRAAPGIGDVVAFVQPGSGKVVVHRMVARCRGGVIVHGDAMPGGVDGIVAASNLLGRVTRVERCGRDVWLGLGPERTAIAWLSRTGRLNRLRGWLASWSKPWRRR